MLATKITNHVDQALARLLQQYQSIKAQYTFTLPVTDEEKLLSAFAGIIACLVDQFQSLEDAIFALDEGRQLFNGTSYPAIGAQLDMIGEIVGLPRNGLSDTEYLIFILGTIAENTSDTTITAVTNIVSTLFQEDAFISLELFPAEMAFEIPDTTTLPPTLFNAVMNIIQASLGAGIGLGFVATYPTGGNGAFQFCDLNGNQDVGGGFGDLNNEDAGGGFAGLIYNNAGA